MTTTTATSATTGATARTGAILLRVSSAVQATDDKASYDVQRAQCLDYASRNSIVVPDALIWQEVGKRDQYYTRDGLQAALTAAKEHRYQVLIVWRMDRLTDNPGKLLRIIEELRACGVTIAYATEPDTNTDTELGQWLAYTKALFQVQPERKTLALRTQAARRRYTEQGRAWVGHSPPYGYRWLVNPLRVQKRGDVTIPLKERFEPDPRTAPVVQQVYAWVDEGRSLDWIARALSGKEDGGQWRKPTPRQHANIAGANTDGTWVTSALTRMLGNPAYKGHYAVYRTKRQDSTDGSEKKRQQTTTEDTWFYVEPSPTPALVDPGLWQRVQTRLTNNRRYAARNAANTITADDALLYRGMARCGECGARMNIKRVYDAKTGEVLRIHYFCSLAAKHMPECVGVGYHQTRELDRAVWVALLNTLRAPDTLARLARREQAEEEAKAGTLSVITPMDELAAAQKKLSDKLRKQQNLMLAQADYAPGSPEHEGYKLAIGAASAEVHALQDECAHLQQRVNRYERVEKTIHEWEEHLQYWRDELWYLSTDSFKPADRRHWLEALNARVVVHKLGDAPMATLELHLTNLDFGATLPSSADVPFAVPVQPVPTRKRDPRDGYQPELFENMYGWTHTEATAYSDLIHAALQGWDNGGSDDIPASEEWIAAYRSGATMPTKQPQTRKPTDATAERSAR